MRNGGNRREGWEEEDRQGHRRWRGWCRNTAQGKRRRQRQGSYLSNSPCRSSKHHHLLPLLSPFLSLSLSLSLFSTKKKNGIIMPKWIESVTSSEMRLIFEMIRSDQNWESDRKQKSLTAENSMIRYPINFYYDGNDRLLPRIRIPFFYRFGSKVIKLNLFCLL